MLAAVVLPPKRASADSGGLPRAAGLVRLRVAAYCADAPLVFSVEDTFRLHLTAHNEGGPGVGLDLVAWGSALEQGLLELSRVELIVGNVGPENKHRILALKQCKGTHGEALATLSLPDLALPAGFDLAAVAKHFEQHPGVYAPFDALVHANVVGRALREGVGELFLAFAPRENRTHGAGRVRLAVTVEAFIERPLRFVGDSEHTPTSHLLRPLRGERYLNLLAHFDGPRAELVPLARELLASVTARFGEEGRVQTAVYAPEPGARARSGRGKAATMLRPKRLDALFAAMETAASVELRAALADPVPPPLLWFFGVGSSVLGDRAEERLSAVAASCDTERLGEPRARALRDVWCALLDGAFARGGVQAVVYRADQQLYSPATCTAYERATGAAEGMSTVRTWAQRWLRLPGNDRLWVGPTLAAHLGEPERTALAELGTLQPCGEGWAFALRERALVPAFERALASLLPTAEQSHAAMLQWYAIPPERSDT